MRRPNPDQSSIASPVGAAALATALLIAPAAQADYYYSGPDGGSWFDGDNWTESASETTGVAPPDGTTETLNINNGIANTGVIFDPAAQAGGVMDYQIGRFYISSDNVGPEPVANSLTINSGRLQVTSGGAVPDNGFHVILGRDAPGTIIQNGGAFEVEADIRFADYTQGTATYVYNGGTLDVHDRIRLAKGTLSTSTFVVRNTDPAGAIRVGFSTHPLIGNADFVVAEGGGSHGTIEFHFENGGVTTIQVGDELSLRNDDDPSTRSARLNLVLEEAPTLGLGGAPIDLGLFTTENGTVSGGGTSNPIFFDPTDTIAYSEGAILSADFGGLTYRWTISYTGNIDLTGGTPLISGPGAGNDVVLIGHSVIPEPATVALFGLGSLLIGRRRTIAP